MEKNIRSIFAIPVVAIFFFVGSAHAARDFSKIEINPVHIAGNVYMLKGAGGNIGVSVGEDGLLMIDDQFAPLARKIEAALKKLGKGELRFVLNTHWHGDHTGGNPIFSKKAPIISHTNVRKRLMQTIKRGNRVLKPRPKEALPVLTFDESLSIHFNGEEIKVIHYPSGHTDGDSVIFFTRSNVVHMGDHMFSGMFPFIDLATGGDVEGYMKNVSDILKKVPANAKIIPGHGPVSGTKELKEFHQMLSETIHAVRKQIQSGKSLAQITVKGLPSKWKSWAWQFVDEERWIATIHESLTRK